MTMKHYDLCVIGGGINGVGIARDAAGRGLSVLLLEKGDLAGATSSASTKLIHGGLRYLEQYEFRLVADSLSERERLMASAPHLIRPLEFILPHAPHLRPKWMIRLGLFLYDRLGERKKLAGSKGVNLTGELFGKPLKPAFTKGFSYSDCWTDDARLVVLNALDAQARGAEVLVRSECTDLKVSGDVWRVTYRQGGQSHDISASCVVNAAGPWVRHFLDTHALATPETLHVRLVQGSHIVTRKLYEGDHAYILQQKDGRIVFAIPYQQDFTLIGTTDHGYDGDPATVRITPEEIEYLCGAINESFATAISAQDVVWSYSGVRPLLDSGDAKLSKVTRDYKLDLERSFGPPLLSIFGGKLTTFRKLSEQAVGHLAPFFKTMGAAWTSTAILPGGDLPDADFEGFLAAQKMRYPWLPDALLNRWVRAYGTRIALVIGEATSFSGLGAHYGDDVYEAEIRYLMDHEWARELEDILWRRSKLGLHVSEETVENIMNAPSLREGNGGRV